MTCNNNKRLPPSLPLNLLTFRSAVDPLDASTSSVTPGERAKPHHSFENLLHQQRVGLELF